MGMNAAPTDDEVIVEMNTTPLIDVMLVLLIMMIITIPVQLHAVNLDLPSGKPPATDILPEVVRLEVDFDGTVLWNQQPLDSPETLAQQLRAAAAQAQPPEFHVLPNRLAEYRHVAAVLAAAQREGIRQIGVVGHEQFVRE